MKSRILLLVLLAIAAKGFSQNAHKLFKDVKEVKVHNIGPIKTGGQVKGYYTFYEYDKADRKNLIFKLDLLDENLNQLGSKEIEGSKKMILLSSAYDGKYFCFKFWDSDANTTQMKVYNQEGQEVVSNVESTKYDPTNLNNYFYQATSSELSVAENNGFINYSFHGPDKGFFVNYVDGNTKKSWSKAYEPENKYKIMTPSFLNGNNEIILTAVSIIGKGINGTRGGNFLLGSNTKDGSVAFDIPMDFNENYIAPINATIENDKITIVGLNYPSYNSLTATPDGFAFIQIDKMGKVLNRTVKSFDETIGKYIPIENHKFKDGNYPYVHEMIRTANGNLIILVEKFKSSGFGGLLLGNLILIEFDKKNEIIQAKEISKEPGHAAGTGFFGTYFSANVANMRNDLDYKYMLKNDDNSEITFNFVEMEEKAVKHIIKMKSFGQVKYKNGKITTDMVPIKNDNNEDADYTWLYPAKTGYFLEVNYYKKKKELSMDFIKLNN